MFKRFLLLLLLGASGFGVYYGFTHTRDIVDWWRLRGYEPASAIELLAGNAGFSDEGTRLFYVHDPVLQDLEAFQNNCSVDEVTIVRGCYISHRNIYIFDVKDERLEGIEEVTAAHEMLHAAYDRLDTGYRERIDRLTADTFAGVTDEQIIRNVEAYRERDESVVPNELHSILATEVQELPAELEEHYERYFTDRQKVITLANGYRAEFQHIEARADELLALIDVTAAQLDASRTALDALSASLSATRTELENAPRVFDSQEELDTFQATITQFNAGVNGYNDDVVAHNDLVAYYNGLVEELSSVSLQRTELQDAVDTRVPQL